MPYHKSYAMAITIVLFLLLHNLRAGNLYDLPDARMSYTRAQAAAEDLEIIRQRVIADLLAPPVDEVQVMDLIKSIKPDGSWHDINYQDVSRTGFEHATHLDNMFHLSRAYKKTDSQWYQNPEVKDAALSALDFWLENDFRSDNWWWNEMGTPGRIINTLLVMDADLNEKQVRNGLRIAARANLEASGARPGGDLIQIAAMLGKQALFRRDETILEKVVSVIAEEIKVTTGRGLKPDMSFHHRVDNVICTLSYGLGYANAFSYWAVKISGTQYRLPDQSINLLIDYFLDGICKSMAFGTYPDPGAKNRDLSRKGTLTPASPDLAESLLKISDYRKAELTQIALIRRGNLSPLLTWNRFFWHSEYSTHQRSGYFASVRLHSSRNHTMEQPHNEEGLKMHHMGDGSNFISQTGREYFDIFPVWNWQMIPGTTILQKPIHPHWTEIAKKGMTDFVGGVSDGKYGAVATDFQSAHDPLKAKKAWFFFDEEYVCLGSSIRAEGETAVYTTLNQCLLNSDVRAKVRKDEVVFDKGQHELNNPSWVLHDNVGYVFPKAGKVHVRNEMAVGNWRDINHQTQASDQDIRMEVFTLWFDHGIRPQDETYEYIVVPGAKAADLERYERSSPVEILENNAAVQAVHHRQLGRTEIVFYVPGKIKLNDHVTLSTAAPCIVMLKTNGKNIEQLVVADPTHKLTDLQLKTSTILERTGDGWQATWNRKDKETTIDIELPAGGYAGQSVILNMTEL